jgi:hypothetical protein
LKQILWYRYIRIIPNLPNSSKCKYTEVEFIGQLVPTSGPSSCDLEVLVNTASGYAKGVKADAYSYSTSVTPFVSAISPPFGSAAGGTVITIDGTNLPEDMDDVIVTVDGVECAVSSTSATQIVCETGPKPDYTGIFGMTVASKKWGAARFETDPFIYMDKWSDRITWAGAIYRTYCFGCYCITSKCQELG